MPFRHLLIALLVVAVWGINFVFIKMALLDIPPFTLAALRFFLAAFPAVFFIRRPQVPWISLIGYGTSNFALQFGFLFTAMRLGMSAGLTSMILQVQVFFTIALSAYFFKERPHIAKIIGAMISFLGVGFVGMHADQDVNLIGLILLLCAAFSWSLGNVIAKSLGSVNALAVVVWGSFVAFPLLGLFALIAEGPSAFIKITEVSSQTIFALIYIVYASTHLGYGLWSWLMREHSASSVAPFALLVPVFGFLSSAVFLHEELPNWKIYAAILVVTGLCVNLYGSRKPKSLQATGGDQLHAGNRAL